MYIRHTEAGPGLLKTLRYIYIHQVSITNLWHVRTCCNSMHVISTVLQSRFSEGRSTEGSINLKKRAMFHATKVCIFFISLSLPLLMGSLSWHGLQVDSDLMAEMSYADGCHHYSPNPKRLFIFFRCSLKTKKSKRKGKNQIKNTPKLLTQFLNILGNVCGEDTIADKSVFI